MSEQDRKAVHLEILSASHEKMQQQVFSDGSLVQIKGLTSDVGRELNGMVGLVETHSNSSGAGRVGVRVGGELRSIKQENLQLQEELAVAESFVSAQYDVNPAKDEVCMLNVAGAESLESAFEASSDASDFAQMRQEPWACRVVLSFSRMSPVLESSLFSSPPAIRAQAIGVEIMPSWGNGMKNFTTSIEGANDLKGFMEPKDLRPWIVLCENEFDASEVMDHLKSQGLPFSQRKVKANGYNFLPESLPFSDVSSSSGAQPSDGDQGDFVVCKTFLELKSDVRNDAARSDTARSSYSW